MLPDVNQADQPNAPVALVTLEIRHPATDSLTETANRELKQLLLNDLPIERQAQDVQWGVTAPGQPPQPVADRFVRFSNRDNTTAASLKNQAIVVETSAYTNFDSFLDIAMRVVDARAAVSSIVGVERIGLRYVLEVRVPPGVDGRIEWSNWIDDSLLGPQRLAPSGLALTEWQGAAVYREAQPGKSLIVRYGPGVGQALDANYHLRRVTPPATGQFFLMDLDSFWTPPTGAIPEYSREALVSTFRDLYAPAQTVFQDMLTTRLKDELLRNSSTTN
ncbi:MULTISPECIES: TIGR04255 family protein [Mycobacterium]|uniref:TIGR04255 family protein n=1 Tax=Mycobacterium kiyosense TaxID=2871094 RepID=A0A9P3Q5W1_9MYCO|nr:MULTISPECIES: TIGR04255 family protein [Mycobacterium]BDB45087.1 TIGR04255 family protein [Mycobacterium kiyosense]BDE16564.1 TIGR04255 family protein [Mycobacterium sp. 20KCMC460]GLB84542.1 TIGR04255 family protein [Mycobacterium kiyosense]GLB92090.1 TIGR04255 family protein [Mycobacterium kiyosense]GLB96526.1 TIGR04255 family protein [Mycobacterium kiyosense]